MHSFQRLHKHDQLDLAAHSTLQTASHFTRTLHVLALAVLLFTYDGGHNAVDATSCSSHESSDKLVMILQFWYLWVVF